MNAITTPQPRHIAVIMDGNGRWAEERGTVRWDGHAAGARAVRRVVEGCAKRQIEYLTLYAFSVNNWSRPRLEVEALMRLLTRFARKEQAELIRQNIRVQVVGEIDSLPRGTRRALEQLLANTANCTGMTLSLALSYGGRRDISRAMQELAQQVASGSLKVEEVDEAKIQAHLSTAFAPQVDLLIRTGGETRMSDFLLWEAAYAELCFLPVMWPDFGEKELTIALQQFATKERRFGLTSAQIENGELETVSDAC
ncbi:MAG: polyprenyl diphosphate synthase [Polyangiaceae bacterium]|nr:polyprenyl diphosphate synthase [Polyangiaceae bacterium]